MTAGSRVRTTGGSGETHDPAELIDSIERERALLDELKTALERQRKAVADDDVDAIEQGVHAVHRILFTLSEASARRRGLVRVLGGSDSSRLGEVVEALGDDAPPSLRKAAQALAESARVVQEALELNRQVLRGAAESGDALIKRLASADTPRDGYPTGSTKRAGALINHEV